MRRQYFRPSFGDTRCGSFRTGHHVDAAHYFTSVLKPTAVIAVIAAVPGDGVVRLEWDGESLERWNHRPEIAAPRCFSSIPVARMRWTKSAACSSVDLPDAETATARRFTGVC